MLIRTPLVQHPVHRSAKPTIGSVGVVVAHSIEGLDVEGKWANCFDLCVEFTAHHFLRRLLTPATQYQGVEGRAVALQGLKAALLDAMIIDIHQRVAVEAPACGPKLLKDRAQSSSP